MAKNIEIQINTGTNSYEVLYPKVDLTNNQGTSLPLSSTSGNLASSRISAGTLTGAFTFGSTVTGQTPTSNSHLTTKSYVDNKMKIAYGTYNGTGSTITITINIGFKPDYLEVSLSGSRYCPLYTQPCYNVNSGSSSDFDFNESTSQYSICYTYHGFIWMKGSDTNYINNRIMVGGMKNNVSAMGWLVITTTSTGCNYYFNALKTASDTQKIALNYNTNGYTYYWRAIKFYT